MEENWQRGTQYLVPVDPRTAPPLTLDGYKMLFHQYFTVTMNIIGAPAGLVSQIYGILWPLLTEQWRFYHNYLHVVAMFQAASIYGIPLRAADRLAILFHDAIYVPGSDENERRSADLLKVIFLPAMDGIPMEVMEPFKHQEGGINGVVHEAMRLILATDYGEGSSHPNEKAQAIQDLDLMVMGAPEWAYRTMNTRLDDEVVAFVRYHQGSFLQTDPLVTPSSVVVGTHPAPVGTKSKSSVAQQEGGASLHPTLQPKTVLSNRLAEPETAPPQTEIRATVQEYRRQTAQRMLDKPSIFQTTQLGFLEEQARTNLQAEIDAPTIYAGVEDAIGTVIDANSVSALHQRASRAVANTSRFIDMLNSEIDALESAAEQFAAKTNSPLTIELSTEAEAVIDVLRQQKAAAHAKGEEAQPLEDTATGPQPE